MKLIGQNQQVAYVAPAKEAGGTPTIVPAVIIEVMSQATIASPGIARLDVTPRNKDGTAKDPQNEPLGHHTAIATYSESKEENTFHFAEPKAAPAKPEATHSGSGARG